MKIEKEYLQLTLPSGFECIVGVLITMTDTFMVSKFGSSTIATVGSMGVVIDFMYLVLQSITVSNNVLVGNLLGKKDTEKMKLTTGTSLLIAIFSSLICILLVFSISGILPNLFMVKKSGLIYLYVRLIGVIPNTILCILSGYQRTLGHNKRMLNVRLVCFVLNALLDFIFVYLGYGIIGVAIATVIVETINMSILIYYCKNVITVKLDKTIAKEELVLIKYNIYERVFKRGSNFALNVIMSRIGTIQYAAHLIVTQFIGLINNFFHGTGIGTQTMIATAIGSEDVERLSSTKKVINTLNRKIVFIITFIIGILMVTLLPSFLIEKESLIVGYKLLIFVLIDCVLSGFYHHYSSILRAMKEFKYISKLNLLINVILKLTLAFALSRLCGIYGVWICFIISDYIMNTFLYKKIDS